MRDFATSDHPAVQAQLDRLAKLSVPQGRLGLDTIREMLGRLGSPHLLLPPTFHVAGTNGKGSTCAYLRAMLEAQGLQVHVATSPHLVRYNERIRIAGKLISDDLLAHLLRDVLDVCEDLNPSFFEVTIAATMIAFGSLPADVCVIEVGLGGRFDATNVLKKPVACGIATLGIDHERFLLSEEEGVPAEPLARIAFEKASIAKPGVPLVTLSYPQVAAQAVAQTAASLGAELFMRGQAWQAEIGQQIAYRDCFGSVSQSLSAQIAYQDCFGPLTLPMPMLPGAHQAANAALAVAMLRHQDRVKVSPEAMAEGIRAARWPARLQALGEGPLTALVPGRAVWLDGGHNPDAGQAISRFFEGQRLHLILGMLANKDPRALVEPLGERIANLRIVEVPGHESHPVDAFGPQAQAADNVEAALRSLPNDGLPVLIAGSLYLAGEVLRLNREFPD